MPSANKPLNKKAAANAWKLACIRVVYDLLLYCCKLILKYEWGGGKRNWSVDATCHSHLCKNGNFFRNASPLISKRSLGCLCPSVCVDDWSSACGGGSSTSVTANTHATDGTAPSSPCCGTLPCRGAASGLLATFLFALHMQKQKQKPHCQHSFQRGLVAKITSFSLFLLDNWPRSSFLFTFGSQHFPASGVLPC